MQTTHVICYLHIYSLLTAYAHLATITASACLTLGINSPRGYHYTNLISVLIVLHDVIDVPRPQPLHQHSWVLL